MVPLREYEKIVERALKSISIGPWTSDDLARAQEVIDDDFCDRYAGDCKSSAVHEWLRSLDDSQREELLFQANTDWNAGQDPWALGSG